MNRWVVMGLAALLLPVAVQAEEQEAALHKDFQAVIAAGRSEAYDQRIRQARQMLAAKQPGAAAEHALAAQQLDAGRWEAYALAGEAAQMAGKLPEARRFFQAAAARADGAGKQKILGVLAKLPDDKKPESKVDRLRRQIDDYNAALAKLQVEEKTLDAATARLKAAQAQLTADKQRHMTQAEACPDADCVQKMAAERDTLNRRQTELNEQVDAHNEALEAWEQQADALEEREEKVKAEMKRK